MYSRCASSWLPNTVVISNPQSGYLTPRSTNSSSNGSLTAPPGRTRCCSSIPRLDLIPEATLERLQEKGVILRETAKFFGESIRLYQHQADALTLAADGGSYVVSTGTGSGKSLTYLLPIVDQILRGDPSRPGVRAILVYPMNALINSQLESLQHFSQKWPDAPFKFARYTGGDQTKRPR